MSRQCRLPVSFHLKGFSLIELMVSLTIGLIIAIAAFSAYLGSSSASKMAEAQGRMNEDAQAALSILTQQIRMAQNNPNQAGRTKDARFNPIYSSYPYSSTTYSTSPPAFALSLYSIRGCDGVFTNTTTATNLNNLTCTAGTNTSPDAIAINYEADAFNSVATTVQVPTDCLGIGLNQITVTFPATTSPGPYSTFPYYVADNRFYIATSASGASSPGLYCQGNGVNGDGSASTAKLIVENIEDMQFNYGLVNKSNSPLDSPAPSVAGYLTADQVSNDTRLNPLSIDARWSKVVSVQVCVLVRSELLVASNMASASYFMCDGTLNNAPPDLRLRRAYYATVVLRNRRP